MKAVALDGSDSASQSFCQLVLHAASKSVCSIPGAPVGKVERQAILNPKPKNAGNRNGHPS